MSLVQAIAPTLQVSPGAPLRRDVQTGVGQPAGTQHCGCRPEHHCGLRLRRLRVTLAHQHSRFPSGAPLRQRPSGVAHASIRQPLRTPTGAHLRPPVGRVELAVERPILRVATGALLRHCLAQGHRDQGRPKPPGCARTPRGVSPYAAYSTPRSNAPGSVRSATAASLASRGPSNPRRPTLRGPDQSPTAATPWPRPCAPVFQHSGSRPEHHCGTSISAISLMTFHPNPPDSVRSTTAASRLPEAVHRTRTPALRISSRAPLRPVTCRSATPQTVPALRIPSEASLRLCVRRVRRPRDAASTPDHLRSTTTAS